MHQQNHEHFADLGRLQFLVLDEADRMVERGHFAELSNVIETLPMPPRIKRPQGAAKATPETLKVFKNAARRTRTPRRTIHPPGNAVERVKRAATPRWWTATSSTATARALR